MFRIVSIGNSFECPSAICLQHRLPSKYERCFLYQIVVATTTTTTNGSKEERTTTIFCPHLLLLLLLPRANVVKISGDNFLEAAYNRIVPFHIRTRESLL